MATGTVEAVLWTQLVLAGVFVSAIVVALLVTTIRGERSTRGRA